MKSQSFKLPVSVFVLTFILLSFVQIKLENPIILAERFVKGAGWIEIFFISCYGAIAAYKMQNPLNVPYWRKLTWTIFSVVFFSQLLLGLCGAEIFLMTGKLHLPVPMMIIAGPIYRGHLSVMTILFVSTVILTGPAWCSQLCYFGAFDNLSSAGITTREIIRNKAAIKSTFLILVIASAILLRWLNASILAATLFAAGFGFAGILVMILFSGKKKKMIHCILYCPVGTLVNILKPINPFRMYIDNSCTLCMKCTTYCKYDALNEIDIRNHNPSITCTLCGDCQAGCHHNSIKYRFLKLSPDRARNIYLLLTITLHSCFLAMARI